ncbi:hypothetical protein BsWGS_09761 [Bradybaena similaris]
MTSLKLSFLLLSCLLFVIVSQGESLGFPSTHGKVNNGGTLLFQDLWYSKNKTIVEDKDDYEPYDVYDEVETTQRPVRRNKGGGRGGRVKSKRRQLEGKKAKTVVAMGKSIDTFSISLYKQMAEVHANNFVFSPFSVFSGLSMLLLGASGRTERELTNGLSLSIMSLVHTAMKGYNKTLNQGADDSTVLALANNLYYKAGLKLQDRFVQKLQTVYGATVEPFKNPKPEEAINDWVERRTKGKITDFLPPGSIPLSVQAMLINAVYFKGSWRSKFHKDNTQSLPFYVTPSRSVNTESMIQTGCFRDFRSNSLDATILELPYVGDEFALFLILPNTNLSVVESKLTADLLKGAIFDTIKTHHETFVVQLPKFGLDTKEEMKEMLKSIGITTVFDSRKASFKKLTKEKKVSVDEVIHQAVIEVDEEGTLAAAATVISIPTSFRFSGVIINRPFMFVLRDKVYGINLFIGRYTNPEGANLKD